MKVFQGPVDVAWQASVLAKFLRKEGVDSRSVVYARSLSEADETILISRSNLVGWIMGQIKTFVKYAFNYDIYHFHFAKSFLPLNLDLLLLKLLGRKIIFHFHGCDIRDHSRPNVKCGQCSSPYRRLQQPLTKFLARIFADKVYVSTPDLLLDFPDATHLPLAYPWEVELKPYNKKVKTLVHATTDRRIKGTAFVTEAVNKLKSDGYKFKFNFIEKKPHAEAQKVFKRTDAGVDQLLLGWYGMFSLEFLAQGKPVLCYIEPKLYKYYKDLPVLTTDPENIYNDLRKLLQGKYSFDAAQAVSFVKRVHDPKIVVRRLIKDYKKL